MKYHLPIYQNAFRLECRCTLTSINGRKKIKKSISLLISDLDLILLAVGAGVLGTAIYLILILRTMCQGKPSKAIIRVALIFLLLGG